MNTKTAIRLDRPRISQSGYAGISRIFINKGIEMKLRGAVKAIIFTTPRKLDRTTIRGQIIDIARKLKFWVFFTNCDYYFDASFDIL